MPKQAHVGGSDVAVHTSSGLRRLGGIRDSGVGISVGVYSLLGFEVTPDRDYEPCEVYLSEYEDFGGGRLLPKHIDVRHAEKVYAILNVTNYKLAAGK